MSCVETESCAVTQIKARVRYVNDTQAFIRDLDLLNFVFEYEEIQEVIEMDNLCKMSMVSFVEHFFKLGSFNTILTIFYHVLPAKPIISDLVVLTRQNIFFLYIIF